MASGVDWLVSVGHPRTGASPSDSPYLGLTKGGESIAHHVPPAEIAHAIHYFRGTRSAVSQIAHVEDQIGRSLRRSPNTVSEAVRLPWMSEMLRCA